MKRSTPVRGITTLAVWALALAALAAPQTKTPFTQTEVTTWLNFGTSLTDLKSLLIMGATGQGVTTKASDSRILGTSTVTVSAVWDMNQLGPLWGSYHKVGPDGTWDGYMQGMNFLENGHVITTVKNVAVGSGGYQGMVLQKTGRGVDHGPIVYTGYIVQGGPGDLPDRVHAQRLDKLQIVGGVLLDPLTFTPIIGADGKPVLGALGLVSVVSGVGEATHIGRETETGLGLIDLTTFRSTAMGTVTSANGDLVNWVASSRPGPNNTTSVDVHYVGGTGKMDDVTGGFSATFVETLTSTSDPMVMVGSFSFTGEGRVRYSAPATIRK
jgi:hypothetical protein